MKTSVGAKWWSSVEIEIAAITLSASFQVGGKTVLPCGETGFLHRVDGPREEISTLILRNVITFEKRTDLPNM